MVHELNNIYQQGKERFEAIETKLDLVLEYLQNGSASESLGGDTDSIKLPVDDDFELQELEKALESPTTRTRLVRLIYIINTVLT